MLTNQSLVKLPRNGCLFPVPRKHVSTIGTCIGFGSFDAGRFSHIHVHFEYSSQNRTRSILITLPDLASEMMLRHSERVRRPPRRLLLSSVPMESQVQARSQNARASDGRQELTGKYQGSGHPDAQERSPSAGWFVEHSNNCVQQQAISHAASPPPSNADSQPVTVISRIEAIFESIAADIQQRRELSIPYCRVRGTRDSNSQLRFPGRSVSEARSFGKIPLLNPRRHSTFLRVVFKLSCFRSPGAMRPRDFASGSYNRQSCDEKEHILPSQRSIPRAGRC